MPRHAITALLSCVALPTAAQEMVSAELSGHAFLPAFSFSAIPADAPSGLAISGRFLQAANRIDVVGEGEARNGFAPPFAGQPIQGFSGFAAEPAPDGSLIALIDNGFGSRMNSPDAMLSWTLLDVDLAGERVTVTDRIWLRDPNRVVPFLIVNEATDTRYLTGSDFDIESIQRVGEQIWIGDEFGPWLLSADLDGVVTGVFPVEFNGEIVRSPDHPSLRVGATAGEDFTMRRSGGFEGMALRDGMLWAMFERPLLGPDGEAEGDFLRVVEFDPTARAWTGNSVNFQLSEGAQAIGDFNMIDEDRALVIERDGGQGDPSLRCSESQTEGCFPRPAEVKVVTLIDLGDVDADGFVARLRQIDLMNIADPDGLGAIPTDMAEDRPGVFTFPFVTIEGVLRDGPEHILVSNDNNFPFSAGRRLGVADDNEVIRLHVPELLAD